MALVRYCGWLYLPVLLLIAGRPQVKGLYCIVPSKRPWVLAAQAPKIEHGRLH